MRKALWFLLLGILVGCIVIAWTAVPDCWQWAVSC